MDGFQSVKDVKINAELWGNEFYFPPRSGLIWSLYDRKVKLSEKEEYFIRGYCKLNENV